MATIRELLSATDVNQIKRVMGDDVLNRTARLFRLVRRSDPTGVSGTGAVAEGVEFSDGTVVMRWLSGTPTTTVFDDMEALVRIHGHQGATTVEWGTE